MFLLGVFTGLLAVFAVIVFLAIAEDNWCDFDDEEWF